MALALALPGHREPKAESPDRENRSQSALCNLVRRLRSIKTAIQNVFRL